MSMVLHELATNAAKYGALSGDEGKVRVAWHVLDDELRVEWRELDGPKAASPGHQWFRIAHDHPGGHR